MTTMRQKLIKIEDVQIGQHLPSIGTVLQKLEGITGVTQRKVWIVGVESAWITYAEDAELYVDVPIPLSGEFSGISGVSLDVTPSSGGEFLEFQTIAPMKFVAVNNRPIVMLGQRSVKELRDLLNDWLHFKEA